MAFSTQEFLNLVVDFMQATGLLNVIGAFVVGMVTIALFKFLVSRG